jgi:uncharacterized protein YcbK (DUF882 family)
VKISQHFAREEFACRCGCGLDTVDVQLVSVLEQIRNHFGVPVSVTSGARCKEHNTAVGGSVKSQHMECKAADIVVSGVDSFDVADYVDITYPDSLGIGEYQNFTHVDVRSTRARW